jgi:hypothetical protein
MRKPIIIAIAALVLNDCNAYNNFYSDYDKSADFSKYKTFAWLPNKADTSNGAYNNKIIRNNIRNYFRQCTSGRGYSLMQTIRTS